MSPIVLHAGVLHLAFFPDEGSVRYIFAGEHEVLRSIGAPVRDQAWSTVRPVISQVVTQQETDSFRVTFEAHCRDAAVDFRWRGQITGSPDGTLTFDFDGEALNDFLRNRIGFCILHSSSLHGRPCQVEHVDGRIDESRFPEDIQPGAPMADLRALTHEVTSGLRAEVRMEGDAFEMEDQRNWTDASFKTFCTPLRLARPVAVPKGTRIHQRVTLRLLGSVPAAGPDFAFPWQVPAKTTVTIGQKTGHRLPTLGVGWPNQDPTASELGALRTLRLSHLRVDVRLGDAAIPAKLKSAADAARSLDAALEIALFCGDNSRTSFDQLRAALVTLSPIPKIARWLLLDENGGATSVDQVGKLRDTLTSTPFAAPIGAGAPDNFTELNYCPAVALAGDFTVHALNPQVHAFDQASMVETLSMQALTAENARRLSRGRPVVISTVTLNRRWRLADVGAPTGIPAGLLPFRPDPRLRSEFAAAWTLGSVAALARAGVSSATYFEVSGENGIVATDSSLTPAGNVFALLAASSGADVVASESDQPLSLSSLALMTSAKRQVLLSNFRDGPQHVRVTGAWGEQTIEVPAFGRVAVEFP